MCIMMQILDGARWALWSPAEPEVSFLMQQLPTWYTWFDLVLQLLYMYVYIAAVILQVFYIYGEGGFL